jgi:hypothetical protein
MTTTTTTTDAQTQEKARWIAQHGSAQLQRLLAAGYSSDERYATERARHEHPDYELDLDQETRYGRCDSPSDDAFAEAERVGGRVMLVSESDDGPRETWEREVIVIENYLGHHTLLRMF